MVTETEGDVAGLEFDWLPVDGDDAVGFFSTAGGGYAPAEFLRDTEVHVYASFFPTVGQMWLEQHTGRLRLCVSRTIALHFIGLLHVQLAVMTRLQSSPSFESPLQEADRAIQVATSEEDRNVLVAAWRAGTPGVEHGTEDGQTTIRIREDRARELAHALTQEIARVAVSHPS